MRIIGGPCQHENYEHSLMIFNHCQEICNKYGFEYYAKASFDKANRSSLGGKRGPEFNEWHKSFSEYQKMGFKTLTDVHEASQIEKIEDVVDVIQIPAFLCRQTDLLMEACKTDKIINIKKGQFLAPWDMKGILSKTGDAKEVWITERGTSFGYNQLVVDFTGIRYMLDNYDVDVVMDATHSVQRPGGNGSSSGGNRDYASWVAFAAAACGVRSFFLEVHEDPDNAPSDGPNMIYLDDFESVVKRLSEIIEVMK